MRALTVGLVVVAVVCARRGSATEHYPLVGTAEMNRGPTGYVGEPAPPVPNAVPRMPVPVHYLEDWSPSGAAAAVPEPAPPPQPGPASLFTNFVGITYTSFYPPDPIAAAGPSELVLVVNGGIALFTKAGVNTLQRTLDDFYNGTLFPPNYTYDPKILYDPHSSRFFAVALDGQASPNSWLRIAVSKSNNPSNLNVGPTGADDWWGFDIDADKDGGVQTNTNWADYPGLGVDQYNLYITANMFTNANVFQYPKVWIIPKAGLIAGGPITTYEFGAPPGGALANPVTTFTDGTIQPALDFDLTDEHMLAVNALGANGYVTFWTVNTPGGTPSLSAANLLVASWNSFSVPDCAQLGGGSAIDTGDTRMLRVIERNGSIWATHTQPDPGATRTEARWYEINPSGPAVLQYGQVTDSSRCYFYPALHPDASGNVCMVMSGVDASIYGSAFYTGRAVADTAGTMQTVASLQGGLSNYVLLDPGSRNRWGDYSGIADDPATGELWMFHEYASAVANQWSTWAGACGFGPPPPTGTPTDTPLPTNTPTPTNTPPPPATCGATPIGGCDGPGKGVILIKNETDNSKDKLLWKWLKGPLTTQGQFGNPDTGTTSYTLCIYDDDNLEVSLVVTPVTNWSPISTKGYKYKDSGGSVSGITKILLKGGDAGKSKILVKGKGGNLPPAALMFSQTIDVTVQLLRNDDSQCWEAVFAPPAVKTSGTQFKDKF